MKTNTFIGGILAAAIILIGIIFVGIQGIQYTPQISLGGAGEGLVARPVTSTTTVVGPQGAAAVKTQVFPATQDCASRVVSTVGTPIMLSFNDIPSAGNVGSTTLSGTVGSVQGASTTVVYDAEQYGCGVWSGWATVSTTITTVEFK